MKSLAVATVVLMIVLVNAVPVHAQDGGPEQDFSTSEAPLDSPLGSGGQDEAGYGCWNCVVDSGFNVGCPSDEHCKMAEDGGTGEGTQCDQDELWSGCHTCATSGGACLYVVVHG